MASTRKSLASPEYAQDRTHPSRCNAGGVRPRSATGRAGRANTDRRRSGRHSRRRNRSWRLWRERTLTMVIRKTPISTRRWAVMHTARIAKTVGRPMRGIPEEPRAALLRKAGLPAVISITGSRPEVRRTATAPLVASRAHGKNTRHKRYFHFTIGTRRGTAMNALEPG